MFAGVDEGGNSLAATMTQSEMLNFHRSLFVANIHHDFSIELFRSNERTHEQGLLDRLYYPKLAEGGVDFEFYTVGGDDIEFTQDPDLIRGTLRGIDFAWREAERSQQFVICTSTDQVLDVVRQGKRTLMLTIEGADPFAEDLSLLRNFYRLGLRSVILTWFKANRTADGVGEKRNGGLTEFGHSAVAEMNRLGILIDITQSASATVEDVFAASTKPVVASHSNACGVHPHRRNLTDEQLRQLKANRGVIGLTSYPAHVGGGEVGLDDLLDHFDYVTNLIGVDHVAVGLNIIVQKQTTAEEFFQRSAIEYSNLWLPGLEDVDKLPALTAGLLGRGYAQADIAKIMGGNFLRVLRAAVG